MKINKTIKLIYSFIFAVGAFSISNINDAFAVRIVPYTLKGTSIDSSTVNPQSPPAYRIYDSPYFADGTILYKQYFREISYYSPKPPSSSIEATDNSLSGKYTNWGFWDFKLNKETADREYKSSFYYSTVTLKSATKPMIATHDGLPKRSSKTLEKGTVLEVLTITKEKSGTLYVYFNGTKAGVTDAKNGVARVKYSDVTPNGKRHNVYFDEYYDTTTTYKNSSGTTRKCNTFYHNFKPYRLKDEGYTGVGHNKITTSGLETVPSSLTTCSLGGKTGEWRYLGLSSRGNPITNPYFVSDWVSFMGNGNMKYYDWSANPWKNSTQFQTKYGTQKTYFDNNNVAGKESVLNNLMNNYAPLKLGWTSGKLTTSEFASRLTLLTHPYDETPVFAGARNTGGVTREFVIKTASSIRDLYVAKVTVKDESNRIVAQGSRSSATASFIKNSNYTGVLNKGSYYTVEVVLGNGSNNTLKSSVLKADVGTSVGRNFSLNTLIGQTNQLLPKVSLSSRGGLTSSKGSTSNAFVYGFKVDDNHSYNYLDIYGFVSADHTGIDNLNYINDTGGLRLSVASTKQVGDLKVNSIELLDVANNNAVVYRVNSTGTVSVKEAIIPGHSYKIKYNASYSGDTLYDKVWKNGQWVNQSVKTFTIPLSNTVLRKVGNTQSSDSYTKTNYFVDSNNSTSIKMENGNNLSYTSESIFFEHPYLETSFTINVNNTVINKSKDNDSLSTTLKDEYDIGISNIRVSPSTEYVEDGSKKVNYLVTYDAKFTVPKYTQSVYQTAIDTLILVNDKQFFVTDFLKPGNNYNLEHILEDVEVSAGRISIVPILNYNSSIYESEGFLNNYYEVSANVVKVNNPFSGNSSDKANRVNNSSSTSPSRGGYANNNCLIPRTENVYTTNYPYLVWKINSGSYNSFNGDKNISYKSYNLVIDSTKASKTNIENFQITDVLFRSKYTIDNNLGDNGWVSMTNSSDSVIKAGYGFELKVIVEYKTNAFLNNPSVYTSLTKGAYIANKSFGTNITTPDLFVELPGDDTLNTRKILSTTGYSGTTNGLTVKRSKFNSLESTKDGLMQVSEWEYTIKPSKTLGVNQTSKIYIPENLKNGDYKISIYTPPVTGTTSSVKSSKLKYGVLCDRKDVYVKVQGSSTDDLNSHNTQQSK